MNSIRNRRYSSSLYVVLLVLLAIGISWGVNGLTQRFNVILPKIGAYETAVVERVVDGDTIHVSINNKTFTVRFIGLDAPESVHPDKTRNTPQGILAASFVKQALPPGKIVYLSKDVSQTDQYGRLLRYVWLNQPNEINSDQEIRSSMFNAILILEGYAYQKTYPPDVSYVEPFIIYQREAKKAKRGLWKDESS